ncbi:MAG: zinc ribbon domain-containing protein [Anaerolineaceae bacterium]
MPIYEYQCQDCGNKFEALRSMSLADSEIHCKNCSSTNTRRLLSLFCSQSSSGSSSGSSNSCGSCAGGNCSSCGQ